MLLCSGTSKLFKVQVSAQKDFMTYIMNTVFPFFLCSAERQVRELKEKFWKGKSTPNLVSFFFFFFFWCWGFSLRLKLYPPKKRLIL